MILYGLDEAALGPSLGPFCACLTSFDSAGSDLYSLCSDFAGRQLSDRSDVIAGDSKQLYSPSRGIGVLEQNVLAFLTAAGVDFPLTLGSLLRLLCPSEDAQSVQNTPWLAQTEDFMLPWGGSALPDFPLKTALRKAGVRIGIPYVRCVPARLFNDYITRFNGKGGAVQSILSPLMRRAFSTPGYLTADRQGGRRYYGEWLLSLSEGALLVAEEESPRQSVYRLGNDRKVCFMVRADAQRMETALASMIAKYIRESTMAVFNRWWTRHLPGIRPTAGYPLDARRFIDALEAAGKLPENRGDLIRLK